MSSERPTATPAAPAAPARRPARARVAAAPAPASRAVVVVAALLLALAAVLLGAGRAQAHNALLGTDPADGSTVDAPPAQITLTFDQPAQSLGTEVVVLGPDGAVVSTGEPALVDSTVSQALAADLPAGAYSVEWRVTSADGHPLSGTFAFTATTGAAAPAPSASAPSATADPTPEPTTSGSADVAPGGATSAELGTPQELAEDEDAGIEAGLVAAVVVAVLAAAAVTVFVVRERRRGARPADGAEGSDGPARADGPTPGDGRTPGDGPTGGDGRP